MLHPLLKAAKENVAYFNKQTFDFKDITKKIEEVSVSNAKVT
jgi:hypothetical protein